MSYHRAGLQHAARAAEAAARCAEGARPRDQVTERLLPGVVVRGHGSHLDQLMAYLEYDIKSLRRLYVASLKLFIPFSGMQSCGSSSSRARQPRHQMHRDLSSWSRALSTFSSSFCSACPSAA